MLAIIGGSGLTTLSNLDVSHREVVRTLTASPRARLWSARIGGMPLFSPRHGYGHTIPPHGQLPGQHLGPARTAPAGSSRWLRSAGYAATCRRGTYRGAPSDHRLPPGVARQPSTAGDAGDPLDLPTPRRRPAGPDRACGPRWWCGDQGWSVYAAAQGPRSKPPPRSIGWSVTSSRGGDDRDAGSDPGREIGLPYAAIKCGQPCGGSREQRHPFESLGMSFQDAMGRVRSIIKDWWAARAGTAPGHVGVTGCSAVPREPGSLTAHDTHELAILAWFFLAGAWGPGRILGGRGTTGGGPQLPPGQGSSRGFWGRMGTTGT